MTSCCVLDATSPSSALPSIALPLVSTSRLRRFRGPLSNFRPIFLRCFWVTRMAMSRRSQSVSHYVRATSCDYVVVVPDRGNSKTETMPNVVRKTLIIRGFIFPSSWYYRVTSRTHYSVIRDITRKYQDLGKMVRFKWLIYSSLPDEMGLLLRRSFGVARLRRAPATPKYTHLQSESKPTTNVFRILHSTDPTSPCYTRA